MYVSMYACSSDSSISNYSFEVVVIVIVVLVIVIVIDDAFPSVEQVFRPDGAT